jgi:prepilin-type N-terminal cleavage/methylation domain-containing protein
MFPAHAPSRGPLQRRPRSSGFSLIEIVVATAVLAIGMLALTSTMWRVHALTASNEDRRLAQNDLRSISEQIIALSEGALEEPETWAGTVSAAFALGGTPGNTFAIAGLEPIAGAPSVGTIRVITDETLTDKTLGITLGMPRDLDGDGAATNTNVTANARLLPVVLDLQWSGGSGNRRARHGFYLLGVR